MGHPANLWVSYFSERTARDRRVYHPAMVAAVFKNARLGIMALCLLLVGFSVDFYINGRQDMDCFAPPAGNLAYHIGQLAFFMMIAGVVCALVALRVDQRKRYAGLTLACFIPLLLIDALRMGCN